MSLIFLPLSLFTLESPFTLLRPHFYPPSSGTFVSIWGFEREDLEVIHSLSCWNLNSLASQRHRFEKAYYFAWKARTKRGGISLLPPPLSILSSLLLPLFSFRTWPLLISSLFQRTRKKKTEKSKSLNVLFRWRGESTAQQNDVNMWRHSVLILTRESREKGSRGEEGEMIKSDMGCKRRRLCQAQVQWMLAWGKANLCSSFVLFYGRLREGEIGKFHEYCDR